jgi:hypothetical protein
VKTARLNEVGTEPAADHVVVLGDSEDVYERVLMLWDKVGAAYVSAHETFATHLCEYQARLAWGYDYDCPNRAASAPLDFMQAVAGTRADLRSEIAEACRSALHDILAVHGRRLIPNAAQARADMRGVRNGHIMGEDLSGVCQPFQSSRRPG